MGAPGLGLLQIEFVLPEDGWLGAHIQREVEFGVEYIEHFVSLSPTQIISSKRSPIHLVYAGGIACLISRPVIQSMPNASFAVM